MQSNHRASGRAVPDMERAAEFGGACLHRPRPDSRHGVVCDAVPVVDDFGAEAFAVADDTDDAVGGVGVAHHVRDGFGDDPIQSFLGRRRQWGQVVDLDTERHARTASELVHLIADSCGESEGCDGGVTERIHQPAHIGDSVLQCFAGATDEFVGGFDAVGGEMIAGCVEFEGDCSQLWPQSVVKVTLDASTFVLTSDHQMLASPEESLDEKARGDSGANLAAQGLEELLLAGRERPVPTAVADRQHADALTVVNQLDA